MHMSSVSLSYVPMVLVDGYFLNSLSILLIIRENVSVLFYVANQLLEFEPEAIAVELMMTSLVFSYTKTFRSCEIG